MAINDARAVIDALADPETLYVFGVLAARTSKLGLSVSDRAGSTPYVRPFGLMRETALSRDAVEAAIRRLNRACLLEVLVDDERGYESWRVSEAALATAANGQGYLARCMTAPDVETNPSILACRSRRWRPGRSVIFECLSRRRCRASNCSCSSVSRPSRSPR